MPSPIPGAAVDHRPVFILASGMRCGSTLQQRQLNSHPKVLIWGETGGAADQLPRGWQHLAQREARLRGDRLRCLERGDGWTSNMCPAPHEQGSAVRQYMVAL